MRLTIIAGARPNFIKIAPIIHAIQKAKEAGEELHYRLVHTGQHYDDKMSQTFFDELEIPEPNNYLSCGGGTQAEQTAAIMVAIERELLENPTDLVIVVGDVNSTMACAITAKKLNIKVAHVEAGIRSFDLTMPEEINRMVTDSISDYFFTTSTLANQNLKDIGVSEDKIFFVGNVMIDTLLKHKQNFKKPDFFDDLKLQNQGYLVLTMHRPNNVDEADQLQALISEITKHANKYPVIFPMHPRTQKKFKLLGINLKNLIVVEPLGYLSFNYLVKNALGVITDSGGITEETTVLGIPCITLRDNTERPETITIGTNKLVGTNPKNIGPAMQDMLNGKWKTGSIPPKWDGKAAERIIDIILQLEDSI